MILLLLQNGAESLEPNVLLVVAALLILGVALAKVAERYRIPHPIPLVVAGIIIGQVLLNIQGPGEELIQIAGFDFIAQLTLACVLFYAGLNMNLKELRLSLRNVLLLATAGVLATSLIAGFTIQLSTQIGLAIALLIGAILSPTDPAALFAVLESGGVRVKRKLFSTLEGEAVFNDATAVILVITVFEPLVIPALFQPFEMVILEFLGSMGFGVLLGFLVARVVGWAILRAADDTNVSILTATTPVLAFGLGELFSGLGVHPGALAAVFAGIFMANFKRMKLPPLPQRSMRGVMKNVSFLFEICVFILLGYTLSVPLIANQPESMTIAFIVNNPTIIILGLITAFLIIFVARPASVLLVTSFDRSVNLKDRLFLSWAGVKGVTNAALAAIAVTAIVTPHEDPFNPGTFILVENAHIIGPTIYSIVSIMLLVSLTVKGLTTPYFAKALGLIEKEDRAREITAHRNATRQALLRLVDLYTEGNVELETYNRMKAELEEEIFTLEDELRRVVSERRARIKELSIRQELLKEKLIFYQKDFESGRLPEGAYQDLRNEIEADLEENQNRMQMHERVIKSDSE